MFSSQMLDGRPGFRFFPNPDVFLRGISSRVAALLPGPSTDPAFFGGCRCWWSAPMGGDKAPPRSRRRRSRTSCRASTTRAIVAFAFGVFVGHVLVRRCDRAGAERQRCAGRGRREARDRGQRSRRHGKRAAHRSYPGSTSVRASFEMAVEQHARDIELRAFLRDGEHVLTETWSYLWQPASPGIPVQTARNRWLVAAVVHEPRRCEIARRLRAGWQPYYSGCSLLPLG